MTDRASHPSSEEGIDADRIARHLEWWLRHPDSLARTVEKDLRELADLKSDPVWYEALEARAKAVRDLIERAASHPSGEGETEGLTFARLRAANVARQDHYGGHGNGWSLTDWTTAVAGEMGEAANLVKKIRRGDFPLDEARGDLAKELADVVTYLDLLAWAAGIDLERAVAEKRDEVADRIGYDGPRLSSPSPPSEPEEIEGRHFYAVAHWQEMATLMLDERLHGRTSERSTPVTLIEGHVGRDVSPPMVQSTVHGDEPANLQGPPPSAPEEG